MKWAKGWKTKIGGTLCSVAVFAYSLPGDMVIGSVKGMPVTITSALGLIGGILGVFGVADKLDGIKEAARQR